MSDNKKILDRLAQGVREMDEGLTEEAAQEALKQ